MEKTLKFKTNLKCSGCVSTISRLLNPEEGISCWTVDLEHSDKILIVESNGITPDAIIEKMKSVGYMAQEL